MRDRTPKIAMLLKRLLGTVKNIEQAIQKQASAANTAHKQDGQKQYPSPEVRAEIHFPENIERANCIQKKKEYSLTKWNVGAVWATFGMVTIYAGIAAYQLCEMRKANKTAKDAIEAQNRPWIGIIGNIEGPTTKVVSSNPPNEIVDFTFKLRNYGQSPATQVSYAFKLAGGERKAYQFKKFGVCDRADATSDQQTFKFLISVFPHDESAPQRGNAQSVISFSGYAPEETAPMDVALLVGCIAYQGQGHLYHTKVLYRAITDERPVIGDGVQYKPIKSFQLEYTEAE